MKLKFVKESETFLNLLFDNVTSAVYIADKDFKVRSLNESFKALFQKSDEKIIGSSIGEAINCTYLMSEKKECGETSQCDYCKIRDAVLLSLKNMNSNKGILHKELLINNEIQLKHFQYNISSIKYNDELLSLIILDDITALKSAENKLIEQNEKLTVFNRQLNHMMSVVAHDLRNPLGAIKAFTEILQNDDMEMPPQDKKDILNTINESSKSCLLLLNDILDYNRFEAGKIALNLEKTDFVALVKQQIRQSTGIAKRKKISIDLEVLNKIPLLYIDKGRIEQLVGNLMSNAIKYSPLNSTFKVKLSIEGLFVKAEFIDKGQGIDENEIHLLFKPFQNASSKTTGGEKSTGLGLAISKGIAHAHGGSIGVDSKLNEGSNFYFYLPISEKHEK